MLLLRRRIGESIVIGGNVRIRVTEIRGGTVRLAIEAPADLPVYRGELVDQIAPENERAVALHVSGEMSVGQTNEAIITFPHTIPGLGAHTEFLLYDVSESIRALVAREDPTVSILLTDPVALHPAYPILEAAERFPFPGDDLAVAVVLCRPADGSMPTVNLVAPIVIDLESRKGAQIILSDANLPLRAPLVEASNHEVQSL
ncbi:MAG: hypothetical protein RL385_4350 [Pseudomonadota bacterium]